MTDKAPAESGVTHTLEVPVTLGTEDVATVFQRFLNSEDGAHPLHLSDDLWRRV